MTVISPLRSYNAEKLWKSALRHGLRVRFLVNDQYTKISMVIRQPKDNTIVVVKFWVADTGRTKSKVWVAGEPRLWSLPHLRRWIKEQ